MTKEELMGKIEIEGDYKSFEYKGLLCEIKRVGREVMGHLCGYVTIPKTNRYYDANEEIINNLDVHGGVTYNTENVIGFDCAHIGDLIPMNPFNFTDLAVGEETYKDVEYVENELHKLVDQIIQG